jgi:hypothetical protein
LASGEKLAFVPEGFLRWMNEHRPAFRPGVSDVPLAVEGVAEAIAKRYREGIKRLGGSVEGSAQSADP